MIDIVIINSGFHASYISCQLFNLRGPLVRRVESLIMHKIPINLEMQQQKSKVNRDWQM
jgi:hypothetical protein